MHILKEKGGDKILKTQEMHRQLVLFLAGFLVGVLYIYVTGYFQGEDTDFLSVNNLMQIMYTDINYKEYFLYLVKKRAGVLFFLVLVSLALPGKYLLAGFLMFFGCSVGNMLSVLIMRYGLKGILLFLALIFPQDIIYIPVLFGWVYLLTHFNESIFYGQNRYRYRLSKYQILGKMIVLCGVTIIGLIFECYVNPMIVIWCIKIF